jgi:hypothetical protein
VIHCNRRVIRRFLVIGDGPGARQASLFVGQVAPVSTATTPGDAFAASV